MTVFNEGVFREEFLNDPTLGVGVINYEVKEAGVFTEEEILNLFPEEGYGPWGSLLDDICFLLACTTGARRGEILALRWRSIDFGKGFITINEAWKSRNELGKAKWEKVRVSPIPKVVVDRLRKLKESTLHWQDDDFVFCYDDGQRLGGTWWRKHFLSAMKKAKINYEERGLKAHSFRHTLNTFLRSKGYNDGIIKKTLGWSSRLIQDQYTHLGIEDFKGQAEIIDNIWGDKNENESRP